MLQGEQVISVYTIAENFYRRALTIAYLVHYTTQQTEGHLALNKQITSITGHGASVLGAEAVFI